MIEDSLPLPATRKADTLAIRIARGLLRLIGWQIEGDLPDAPKFVLIVAPHTSNWDVPIGLICAYALGLLNGWPYGYMVKDSAVRWPVLGALIRWLGGIPINRRAANNVVEQMADFLRARDRFMLAITPEGTRKKTAYWKTGFYHIACQAQIPIVLAFLDYARKVGGIGPVLLPSGDIEADFEIIRKFYAGVTARFPHEFGEVRAKPQAAT